MKDVIDLIKTNRPKLSDSSIKTYVHCLKNVFSSVFPKDDFDVKLLIKDYKKVLDYLKDVKFNVRKTILSALTIISINHDEPYKHYRTQMIEDSQKYQAQEKENKMTDTQRENWISWKEILEILELLRQKYYYIFKQKNPKKEDILDLQKYIILSCYTLIPPRRSQDFCLLKVKNYNPDEDNYYFKGNFVFNKYKTAKFSGTEVVTCPKSLQMLLKKWIDFHKQDYLFTDYYDKPLTSSGMSKILNSIFDKKISVNMLRHSYITSNLSPLINKLEETAKNMGHSVGQQKLYVKFN